MTAAPRRPVRGLLAGFVAFALATSGTLTEVDPAHTQVEPGTEVTSFGLNASHDRVQPNETVAPPFRRAWKAEFDGDLGNPIIADGRVFVSAAGLDEWTYGARVYALRLSDGAPLWGPVTLGGPYSPTALTYANGRLFALEYDGLLRALDGKTGAELWSLDLAAAVGGYFFDTPPVAFGESVYVASSFGSNWLVAVDAATGAVRWSRTTPIGTRYGPAVDSTGIYLAHECDQIRVSLTGEMVWFNDEECLDWVSYAVQLIGDHLYVNRDIYRKSDGSLVGTIATSAPPIAISDGLRVEVEAYQTITARDADGATVWRNALHTGSRTGPVVAAGYAFFGYEDGLIEAIDLRTGRTVWSATAGDADIPWSDRFVHDLSVAGGHLIVPTGYELSVYEPLPVSIRGPTRALRGSQVTLVTHSAPGSRVEIYRKESGATAFSLLAVRQADSTGRAAASFSIRRDTDYYALSDGVQSPIRHTKAIRDVAIPAGMPNTRAGNYQINPTHTGAQSQEVLRPPLRRAWARAFPGRVSYPVVFGGRAFVVAEAAQGEPTDNPRTLLYALEAATGELLWGPIKLDSQARFAAVASDGDRLYLLNQRLLGDTLSALDPATGNELWSVGLGGGFPPTAVDGAVYLAGGTAIDGVTGDPVASATGGGWRTRGPPAVSRSRVFSSMSCPAAQAYSTDGQFLWQSQELTGECDQWSFTTAVHDGRVYVRSRLSDDAVYRASDGHLLRRFSSEPIPAFAGQVGYRVVNGRLIALMSRQA